MEPLDAASIEIRPLATPAELAACVALQRDTWGADFGDVVPLSILKVVQRIGGVAAGAFAADGALVGFVFGVTGVERGAVVHWSDMLAVHPRARNLGLGRRLKEHQRNAVRAIGGTTIYWTFDPLVARNAHLNFNRLGVRLAEYVDDMYGRTDSPLHGGIATDRLVVAWPTDDDEVQERLGAAEQALASSDCAQSPVVTAEWVERVSGATILPHCVRIEIPAAGEAMLCTDPAAGAAWRAAVRGAFRWALGAGYVVDAFQFEAADDHGYYVLTRPSRPVGVAGRA